MLVEDSRFDGVVQVARSFSSSSYYFNVWVGDILVASLPEQAAQALASKLRDSMVNALKHELIDVAKNSCSYCRKGLELIRNKKFDTIYHKTSIGPQECEATDLWQAMLRDQRARKMKASV